MNSVVHRIDGTLELLREEAMRDIHHRDTGATDSSLASVIGLCEQARDAVQGGDPDLASLLLQRVARRITDEWSLKSDLSATTCGLWRDLQ